MNHNVRITQFLCHKCVIADLEARTKDEVLSKLADAAKGMVPSMDTAAILNTLKEREQLGSTGIGNGVAIPHGKIAGLDRLVVVVARSVSGVPFESIDNNPVHTIFLLLAPDHSATLYLKVLARISRLLKMEGLYEKLVTAQDTEGIIQAISEVDNACRI